MIGFVYRAKQQRLNRQKQLMHEKRLALFKQRRTSKSSPITYYEHSYHY